MNEELAQKRRLLSPGNRFRFSCHNEISCFNTCCADISIFLMPYDILRMRRASGLSSGEFLKRYTIPLLVDNGLPLAALKMMDNKNKTCPFVASDGCKIYQDRPWSCRMFPIFTSPSGGKSFFIEERNSCLGYKEEKWWTIEGWKKDQGIDIYDKMNELYEEITLNEFFLKGNKLDPEKSRMLYLACYDLDEFKKFLFETRYFDAYDVERGIVEKIEKDQEQLLDFGYKWAISNLLKERP